MLPWTASSEVRSPRTLMASCRVSSVDQRFSRSTSSTLPPQLSVTMSASTGDARQQHHVSPFHVGPAATDFSVRPTLGANHSLSVQHMSDDQPLDLTGGGTARKRAASPDEDSPLDLSVKRSRTDDGTPLSDFSMAGVGRAVPAGVRAGLAMCGGGVVGQSPIRSVHVARSPIPLSKLHATGHQLPTGDVPRLGVGVGAVPVIRRVSSTSLRGSGSGVRGSRTGGGQPRPSTGSSRMMNDEDRLSSTRHARDVTVVVNGHRPDVVLGAKDTLTGNHGNIVRPAFPRVDYAGDRHAMGAAILPGRQSYLGKAYDRSCVTLLGGRSHVEPLIAASPTSVSSLSISAAYITPPQPIRPNAIHSSSVARRLDPRSTVLPTLASFPESSSSLMSASHRVTLVDRLDPTETRQSATFLPSDLVASSSLKDLDSGGLYFGDNQSSTLLITPENSGERTGFPAPIWSSLAADVTDSERSTSTKSCERSSAFGGISPAGNCVSEVSGGMVDDRGEGPSVIVAERNFAAITQMVDIVDRQRAPFSSPCSSTGGGSLLGHLTSATRRVPVANVHPIMKNSTQTAAAATAPPSSTSSSIPDELPIQCHRVLTVSDDDACSQLTTATTSISSGRPLDPPAPLKDVTSLLTTGFSRGGRVSSHHMEYVKFLRQNVDDTSSVASFSAVGGSTIHPRSVRNQPTVDKRRGSTRGGATGLSAKARRQLLPYFHHDPIKDDQGHQTQITPSKVLTDSAASDNKPSTIDLKNSSVNTSSSSEEHSCASSGASSASTGRKTTPIVYFDDDEFADTDTPAITSGSPATTKQLQQSSQGAPAARKPPGKPGKIVRGDLTGDGTLPPSSDTASGKPSGGTVKRRKRVTAETKTDRSNVETAHYDDDLTDFEDVQPSTSAQVSCLHLPGT